MYICRNTCIFTSNLLNIAHKSQHKYAILTKTVVLTGKPCHQNLADT